MSKYRFSDSERWAVFSVYGQHCYLCRRPIDFRSMVVDHIIPEQLLTEPEELKAILKAFNLPSTFDLNAFGNWLPACGPCNTSKSASRFEPSPLIQLQLQRARTLAPKASASAAATVTNRQIGSAFAALSRASANQKVSAAELGPLVSDFLKAHPDIAQLVRDTLDQAKLTFSVTSQPVLELRLAENATVVFSEGGAELVHGRYGTGYRPRGEEIDPSFYCARCGSLGPWNGARCMSCGFMDCGD